MLWNPCDFASRHPSKVLDLSKLCDTAKADLRVGDKLEDISFSVNRVVVENINGSVTRGDIIRETKKEKESDQSCGRRDVRKTF